jgi:hypothetical protein
VTEQNPRCDPKCLVDLVAFTKSIAGLAAQLMKFSPLIENMRLRARITEVAGCSVGTRSRTKKPEGIRDHEKLSFSALHVFKALLAILAPLITGSIASLSTVNSTRALRPAIGKRHDDHGCRSQGPLDLSPKMSWPDEGKFVGPLLQVNGSIQRGNARDGERLPERGKVQHVVALACSVGIQKLFFHAL